MIHLPELSVELLTLRVGQLYRLDCAGLATCDPVQGEAVARWLDANPELRAQVWALWAGWMCEEERDLRGYWLDVCLLGGIALSRDADA